MSTRSSVLASRAMGAALCGLLLAACDGEKALQGGATTGSTHAPAPPPRALRVRPHRRSRPPPIAAVDFAENDFVESDRNRDPLPHVRRDVRAARAASAPRRTSAPSSCPQFSIDELKLVAIVTGGEYPRAMMIDPGGKGWVLKRGDFVGRPEIVHIGGANGSDYPLNWRVDKVRDGDIVFLREDPAQPGIPPATRVVTLHPEADNPKDKID